MPSRTSSGGPSTATAGSSPGASTSSTWSGRSPDEDPELVARFEARYANARAVAEPWRNKLHGGDKPETARLADYLALIGYPVPMTPRPATWAPRSGTSVPRLARGLPLTAPQQARWDRLVEHNRFDCAGLRAVCLRATRELEAT